LYAKWLNNFFQEVVSAIKNLIQLLDNTVKNYPGRVALIRDKKRFTYEQLHRSINAVARLLRRSGIGKGDKVALMLPNIPEFVYGYFGILKCGAVAVTLNTASTPYELTHLLNNSDSKILITQAAQVKKFDEVKDKLADCRAVVAVESLFEEGELLPGISDEDLPLSTEIIPEDPAVMIYTAGLTGRPLGAVLTHHNLCSQANIIQDIVERKPEDVALALIPLFHAFGATTNMLLVIRAGAAMVMMDRLTMESLFSAIERERITYISAVPRLYMGMIFYEKASKYDLSSLKVCITGGAPMPPEFMPVFEQKFGIPVFEGYGLTEASPVCSFNRLDKKPVLGSIGVPMPGIEMKVVNDQGRELPCHQIGEVVVKGDNVMLGYYKDEKATASVIRDGWLHTGDLGRIDEEGYIFLTGRKKRMIITSGFNVYPREVEAVLELHPAVASSYAAGKEDLMRGEIVKAFVVLKKGFDVSDKEIIRHCKHYLSSYKVPREVEFVEKLPAG
jgi:long-chain acyl-CoA synthetase